MAALAAAPAGAQVLYKWVDANGRVVYSDRLPPKGFIGKVERIEPDAPATPVEAAPPVVPRPAAETAKAPPDMATQRRATRVRLQANLDAARERVEAARKALTEGSDPQSDDRRIIQQRVDGTTPTTTTLRNNCRTTRGADGKDSVMCPTALLNEEYFARVEQLEEALRKAEEDLSAAELAYRRGVD